MISCLPEQLKYFLFAHLLIQKNEYKTEIFLKALPTAFLNDVVGSEYFQ